MSIKLIKTKSKIIKLGIIAMLPLMLLLFVEPSYAVQTIAEISDNMGEHLTAIANLLAIIAYVAGIGFLLAGVIQFKTHKDNPQQVPLSKPIVYLIVGAFLLFLPTLINVAGQTIFGKDKSTFADTDVSTGKF